MGIREAWVMRSVRPISPLEERTTRTSEEILVAEGVSSVRQAIVVIHGIGEQRPGDTLHQMVDAIIPERPKPSARDLRTYRSPQGTISRTPFRADPAIPSGPISLCGHLDRESDSGKVCGGGCGCSFARPSSGRRPSTYRSAFFASAEERRTDLGVAGLAAGLHPSVQIASPPPRPSISHVDRIGER